MLRPFLALVLAAGALPAAANTIYRCTDENGGTLISNTRVDKSCKAVTGGESAPQAMVPAPVQRLRPPAAANPSPVGFPKVAEETQKARDSDRRRILEQELASEQRSLEVARKDLAEQESAKTADDRSAARGLDRLQPYRERVGQHERNIAAINKELANLR